MTHVSGASFILNYSWGRGRINRLDHKTGTNAKQAYLGRVILRQHSEISISRHMHIITPRMHLIPATLELLYAELQSSAALSAFIGAYVPGHWPPALYDEPAIRWTIAQLSKPKVDGRWYLHYFVLQSRTSAPDVVIGAGGYRGAPDPTGTVTIGYSILPEYQRRGLAAEAVAGLLQNAFIKQVKIVAADTLEGDPKSGGVLLKNGFRLTGPGPEPGTSHYELTKAEWKAHLAAAQQISV